MKMIISMLITVTVKQIQCTNYFTMCCIQDFKLILLLVNGHDCKIKQRRGTRSKLQTLSQLWSEREEERSHSYLAFSTIY